VLGARFVQQLTLTLMMLAVLAGLIFEPRIK
jgi:hypothetical protein